MIGQFTTVRGALRLGAVSIAAVGLSAAAVSAACQRATPAVKQRAASATVPLMAAAKPATDPIAVEGHERLEWDQEGPSLDEVKSYRYMAVVGRKPSDLQGVTCAVKASGGPFVCSSELPQMARGIHQVWVIAVAKDGARVLVSRWSPPLTLQKR